MPRLPDEIISEILSPALKVADELFSDMSYVSPFATLTPSTSAYLLVCKDWLRVATPLLYNVVVLRSKAQAAALQQVLRKNPDFGGFIKKLRVEGGYGMAMHTILASAPNITDLFLTLAIWSSDSTNGLCKGLPLINPHRVIVADPVDNPTKVPKNKNQTAFSHTLFRCISKWDNLETFGFPYSSFVQYDEGWSERANNLIAALIKSNSIRTVLLPHLFDLPTLFHPLLDIPGLRILHFHNQRREHNHQQITDAIKSHGKRGKLNISVRYKLPDRDDVTLFRAPEIAPSLDPYFVPMASAPAEVQETVWKRIFVFALSRDDPQLPQSPDSSTDSRPTCLAILLVSKYFNQLGLSALFNDLRVTSRNASSIIEQLHNHSDLGSSIHFLNLCYIRDSIRPSIISRANRVERVHAQFLSPEESELLAVTTGFTLRKLLITLTSASTISASTFAHFTNLQVCKLHGEATFSSPSESAVKTVLAKLHTLELDHCGPTIFDAFSAMRQPSHPSHSQDTLSSPSLHPGVDKLSICYGGPLVHMGFNYNHYYPWNDFNIFDVCTSLLDVNFYADFELRRLNCKDPHKSLAKIACNDILGCGIYVLWGLILIAILHFTAFREGLRDADNVDPALFPVLREIQCRSCYWPKSEYACRKNAGQHATAWFSI
ncbi:hypothetical protein C8R43DRAFT_1175213 [Mycena crocata]|nr:hypothetical protein C8R43DRAFT_1175213 [Mycena crocata]